MSAPAASQSDQAIPSSPVNPTEEINFRHFTDLQLIDSSDVTKYITFRGKLNGHTAVIRLDKTPFDVESAAKAINDPELNSERTLNNDVYSRYKFVPATSGVNELKVVVVCPASETVLAKYSGGATILCYESKEMYASVSKVFIDKMVTEGKDYNQWVFNILDGKTEQEHIEFNDPDAEKGFVLLPSLKSTGDEKDVHYIALCHRRDIRSLRDLDRRHLPLLHNIHINAYDVIGKKYDISQGRLRAYIHYHPTFYHFHVHFQLVDPSEYKTSDRDHLLIHVIENIQICNEYYQEKTLVFPLAQRSPLWKHMGAMAGDEIHSGLAGLPVKGDRP